MRFGPSLGLVLLIFGQPAEVAAQGAGADWPTYGGDYSAWRHSHLNQITADNVKKLVSVWAFQTGDYETGLQSTPIVVDGVIYLSTGTNLVYALDGATGEVIWKYEYDSKHPIDAAYFKQNRGVAIGHGLVFLGTVDNHVLAIDQKTGREVWRTRVQDPAQCGCGISAAPLLVKDLVVVGGTGGDFAHRGSLTAFHAKTGRFAWRFYITPAPGEAGHETWAADSWRFGGGAPWMTGSYDPELDLIYWGTGNAAPDLDGAAREGDNLYTASVVALDADTGKLRWHYQEVPHDMWDYDSAYECILADLPVRGKMRKLLIHPTKTGYVWMLDRTNGEFIGVWRMVEDITWVSGITEDGKLVGRKEPIPGAETNVCPSISGAKSWNQAAFSPNTGLVYMPLIRFCSNMYVRPQPPREGKPYSGGFWYLVRAPAGAEYPSGIAAFDAVSGEKKWEYPYKYVILSSVLSTAGGLVFAGDGEGEFFALDAETGEKLWAFRTGSGHRGSSVSYEIDGRQYVATPSGWGSMGGGSRSFFPELARTGGALFVFALPEQSEAEAERQ